MTLSNLLDQIRDHFLKRFRTVLKEQRHAAQTTVIIEPALLQADGEAARAGVLNLPVRVDLVICSELKTEEKLQVVTETVVDFEPLDFHWENSLAVSLHPFHWEACPVTLQGAPAVEQWWPLLDWFDKWFDEFDTKAALKRDIQEVVHFLSDPEFAGDVAKLTVDFGTSPVSAFEEFLDALRAMRPSAVRIGE